MDEGYKMNAAIETINAQAAEIKGLTPLAKFGEKVLEQVKDCVRDGCFELEAEDLADFAGECGLFQHIPYDPAKHGELECEPGDMIYWWGTEADDERTT